MPFLPLSFFNRPPEVVAPALLGQELTHTLPNSTTLSGLIVEAEAYHAQNDPAAHSARGPTPATCALRMGPGTLYIHPMRAYVGMDIVTAHGSVLLRGILPRQGFPPHTPALHGPGKLCRTLQITKEHYGLNITDETSPLRLFAHPAPPPASIQTTPRIGITKNKEALLRFTIREEEWG
ncbi:MAG: hypothetical protein GC129_03155 [Proteobacteria bacterium]|nr:hypothetical protein [Pseudomonadota bacterium]